MLDRRKLTKALKEERYTWRRHVLERLAERGLSTQSVLTILVSGEQIEDYPEDKPFPSALFLGRHGERPLHVVAAYDPDADWAFIVTAYEPDLEHFRPDFKTRRRR